MAAGADLDPALAGLTRLALSADVPPREVAEALSERGIAPVVFATGASAAPSEVMATFDAGLAALEAAVGPGALE